MKRFLSLLLAMLMVIGLVPVLVVGTGAEESPETIPDLVITEVFTNPVKYETNIATWKNEIPAFYSSLAQNAPSGIGRVFRYMEIYNGGEEAVDLYNYKLGYDSNAATAGTELAYYDFASGDVTASKKTGGFYQKIALDAYTSALGYFTYNGSAYTEVVDPDALVQPGVGYYEYIANDVVLVTNPETALLQPGECALVWFYTSDDAKAGATVEQFKGYYEWKHSYSKTNYSYGVDLSDTLVITMGNFKPTDGGTVYYGLVEDRIDAATDADIDQWVSRARMTKVKGFYGTHADVKVTLSAVAGTTDVLTGTVFVYDEETATYYNPSIAEGTADANGKAVEGITYYSFNISKIGNGNYSNTAENVSANFAYGYDIEVPLCEGYPYTIGSTDLTPGLLTPVQAATLPKPGVEAKKPSLIISEVGHRTAKTDNYAQNAFQYIEVTNVSDTAVNVYDYSVLLNVESYMLARNEYFSKVHSLIPGDVGNIYAASPDSEFYHYDALTNPAYADGWLMPGESAALWGCTLSEVPKAGLSMNDFYKHYNLDSSVKVFAYDADPTYINYHQHMNNGKTYLTVGLAKNENIGWTGAEYLSPPVLSAVAFPGCVSSANNRGISFENCESFALCNSQEAMGFILTALPFGRAYQFTYNGSKMAVPTSMFRIFEEYASDTAFAVNNPPVVNGMYATPGTLSDEQKKLAGVTEQEAIYVLYMQDYNKLSATESTATALSKTGMTAVEGAVSTLALADGKLTVANAGTAEERITVYQNAVLAGMPYVVTYDVSFGEGETLVEKTVTVSVDAEGVATVTVNGIAGGELGGSYLTVNTTANSVEMVVGAGVTAVYDEITVYTEENLSENEDMLFYTVGQLADGTAVWLYSDIVGGYLTEAFVTVTGGTVVADLDEGTSISFAATVDRNYINDIEDIFDVSVSMLVYRTDDLGVVKGLTPDAFENVIGEGAYLYQTDMTGTRVGANYRYYTDALALQPNYYCDTYAAVAMVSVETALGTVTWSSTPSACVTATQVVADAMQDTSDTRSDVYCYDMGDGTWARYSAEQMKAFAKFIKQAA